MQNQSETCVPENWQPPKNKLLNPCVDAVFKAIFTSNSKASRNALISFLSAVLERNVSHVTLEPNELPVDKFGQKQANFDITCLLDGKEPANVEIQTYATDTLFKKRVEYHVAHLLNHFVEKGKKWDYIPKSYQISIVDFIFNSKTKNCVSRYEMQTEDRHKLESRMNIIIIELPKIKKMGNIAPEKLTKIEKWGKFFVDADDPERQDYMHDIAGKEEGIMNAQEILMGLNVSYSMWTAQEHHDNVMRERAMMKREQEELKREIEIQREKSLQEGRQEGIATGIQQGIQQGLQQGAHEKAVETARGMLSYGMPKDKVAEISGLTLEEVQALAE